MKVRAVIFDIERADRMAAERFYDVTYRPSVGKAMFADVEPACHE